MPAGWHGVAFSRLLCCFDSDGFRCGAYPLSIISKKTRVLRLNEIMALTLFGEVSSHLEVAQLLVHTLGSHGLAPKSFGPNPQI